jgi:hypothetical protein
VADAIESMPADQREVLATAMELLLHGLLAIQRMPDSDADSGDVDEVEGASPELSE